MRHQLMQTRRRQRGTALVEFVLMGIPLIFLAISVEEMSRGMWQYHTLQFAAKQTASYASVHGATCDSSPNTCTTAVSDVVGVFTHYAVGIPTDKLSLTLYSQNGSVTCAPVSTCSSGGSWSSRWPPTADNAVGNWIKVRADYTFSTALAMFLPGAGRPVQFGSNLGAGRFDFPGYSYQLIQF